MKNLSGWELSLCNKIEAGHFDSVNDWKTSLTFQRSREKITNFRQNIKQVLIKALLQRAHTHTHTHTLGNTEVQRTPFVIVSTKVWPIKMKTQLIMSK